MILSAIRYVLLSTPLHTDGIAPSWYVQFTNPAVLEAIDGNIIDCLQDPTLSISSQSFKPC